jgi:hypothetical protein
VVVGEEAGLDHAHVSSPSRSKRDLRVEVITGETSTAITWRHSGATAADQSD